MTNYILIQRLMSKVELTVTEAMCLVDLCDGTAFSWTFAPPALKRKLRPLISVRKLVAIREETFEGDAQVYEFLCISEIGHKVLGALSR